LYHDAVTAGCDGLETRVGVAISCDEDENEHEHRYIFTTYFRKSILRGQTGDSKRMRRKNYKA
jgi:hypothetical protein